MSETDVARIRELNDALRTAESPIGALLANGQLVFATKAEARACARADYEPNNPIMEHPSTEARFVEALRIALIEATSCTIQESADGKEWPCGTCACALLENLLPHTAPEYAEHNDPVDRVNEVWRAVLQMRDYQPKYSPCQKSNPPAALPNS